MLRSILQNTVVKEGVVGTEPETNGTSAADAAVLDRMRSELSAALLSDALDSLGYRRQVLPPSIRPLDSTHVLAGRARTGLYQHVFHIEPGENPYELEIALVDDLAPGEVCVLSCPGVPPIVPWGELLTNASIGRGAAGCLTDGYVRDSRAVRELGFPVFHAGFSPLDAKGRGKIVAIDVPVEIGGVSVSRGDVVFGDEDGVVIIPARLADEVIALAFDKRSGETSTRDELRAGMPLREVFARHGIL